VNLGKWFYSGRQEHRVLSRRRGYSVWASEAAPKTNRAMEYRHDRLLGYLVGRVFGDHRGVQRLAFSLPASRGQPGHGFALPFIGRSWTGSHPDTGLGRVVHITRGSRRNLRRDGRAVVAEEVGPLALFTELPRGGPPENLGRYPIKYSSSSTMIRARPTRWNSPFL
jgi:hypothetical protein